MANLILAMGNEVEEESIVRVWTFPKHSARAMSLVWVMSRGKLEIMMNWDSNAVDISWTAAPAPYTILQPKKVR